MDLSPRQIALADQVEAELADHIEHEASGGIIENQETSDWFDNYASNILTEVSENGDDANCCGEVRVWSEDPTNDPIAVVCYPEGFELPSAPGGRSYVCYEHHLAYVQYWMTHFLVELCVRCAGEFASDSGEGQLVIGQFGTLIVAIPLCNECVFGPEQ